jgi:hypothetical protein
VLSALLTHELSGTFIRAAARILAVLAAGGVIASLVGLTLGYASVQEMPALLAAALGILLVPTFGGLLAVSVGGLGDLPHRQRAKMMYAGCPPWLRRLVYGLMVFGAINFFGRFALEAKGMMPALEVGFPSVTFSSFSLIVFAAGIGQTVSFLVLRARLDASRCPHGHPVPLEARFCPTCGESVTSALTAP